MHSLHIHALTCRSQRRRRKPRVALAKEQTSSSLNGANQLLYHRRMTTVSRFAKAFDSYQLQYRTAYFAIGPEYA